MFRCSRCTLQHEKEMFITKEGISSLCEYCREKENDLLYQNKDTKLLAEILNRKYIGSGKKLDVKINRKERKKAQGHSKSISFLPEKYRQCYMNKLITDLLLGVRIEEDFKKSFQIYLGINDVIKSKNSLDKKTRDSVRYNGKFLCTYCGRYGRSVDHKNPVSKSLDNSKQNLVNSCYECNKLKGEIPYEEFIELNTKFFQINNTLTALNYENNYLSQLIRELSLKNNEDYWKKGKIHAIIEKNNVEIDKLFQVKKHYVKSYVELKKYS